MIDPIALRSLVAIDRRGTVIAAAADLGYTPSAVSQQIKKLESQTGVQLLERRGRGVLLTEAGRSLRDSAGDLLAQFEAIESRLKSLAGAPTGTVRLAAFSTGYRGMVIEALGRLGEAHPDVSVRPEELDPWEATASVAAGSHDLALVHNWEPLPLAMPEHVQIHHLGRDRADLVVGREHPLAEREFVTVDDVSDETWVSVGPGSICHQWLDKMFADIGRAPLVGHVSGEFATHLALAAAGQAVALVPRLGRGPLPAGAVAIPMTRPVCERSISLVWRRTMGSSPALQAVIEALVRSSTAVLTGPTAPSP